MDHRNHRVAWIVFISLILAAIACTAPIQESAEEAAQEAVDSAISQTIAEITERFTTFIDETAVVIGDTVEPYMPTGFIDSVQWVFDNTVPTEIVDPLMTAGSTYSDALELYIGSSGSKTIPLLNIGWSGLNVINSGSKCLEQHDSVLELGGKDCVDAALNVSSGLLAVAGVVAVGTASTPLIMGLGAGVAGLQLLNNVVKWE